MTSATITSLLVPRIATPSSRDSSDMGSTSIRPAAFPRDLGAPSHFNRFGLLARSKGRRRFCRWFFFWILARRAPFLETPDHDEKRGHEQHGEAGRGEHAGKDRNANRLA